MKKKIAYIQPGVRVTVLNHVPLLIGGSNGNIDANVVTPRVTGAHVFDLDDYEEGQTLTEDDEEY